MNTLTAINARVSEVSVESSLDEAEWLAQVRNGNERACGDFVRCHGGPMIAVARRLLRCEEDVADAVQEAFLAAFRALPNFAGNSRIGTWLHRIVVNVCLMKLRAQKGKTMLSIDSLLPAFDDTGHHAQPVASWDSSAADRLDTEELRSLVRERINMLPEPYRVVLLLRDIEEFNTRETAERLNITEAAVKVRLHRARQALRTLLEPIFQVDHHCRASA
jgi:RNA polymerase sigma-70 factor (ECF subfamily)